MNSVSKILNTILRNAQSEGFVDRDVTPAMRDGRLVIPVDPSHKRRIRGIVHDESASGKTVYIEPAEVVEANNRIRELENEERREIIRILTDFTDYLRPFLPDLLEAYEFLGWVDFIRAKAKFAGQIHAIKPVVENRPEIDWVQAVHPLLYLSLQKQNRQVVPLDIALNRENRILIISGPMPGKIGLPQNRRFAAILFNAACRYWSKKIPAYIRSTTFLSILAMNNPSKTTCRPEPTCSI